jgi:GTP-binding protein LepA
MKIRNFAIIAHIDHGKSTLADRLMEITGVVEPQNHEEQLLDRNPISRQRGITIKLAPVQLHYQGYTLNLVDTPGHVDFSYEVERTLACVEGVILLVDATQGIQAQTIAHTYKALEQGLTIMPVINKIDRPEAQTEKVRADLAKFLKIEEGEILAISAKTGQNCEQVLEAVIQKIPSPKNNRVLPATTAHITPGVIQGLIFDSC